MREFGLDVRLFSTRPPPHESSARHAFAKRAREETTYLWPRSVSSILGAIGWALLTRPHRLVRAAACGLTLDEMSPRERIRTLPLVGAACVLARDARSADVQHLHVHSAARSTMIAMMTRRLTGLSFSLTLHGDLGWWGGGMGSKLKDAEFTVVVAEWLRDDILASYPDLRPNQILVGSMGVDTRKWVPEERLRENSSSRSQRSHDFIMRRDTTYLSTPSRGSAIRDATSGSRRWDQDPSRQPCRASFASWASTARLTSPAH